MKQNSNSNNKGSSFSRRSVSFGVVQVREYQRIAGDHPGADGGPPLGIGWKFIQKSDIQVTTFEKKQEESARSCAPLNAETRRFILSIVHEISKENIRRSELRAEKVRQQRQNTYRQWQETQARHQVSKGKPSSQQQFRRKAHRQGSREQIRSTLKTPKASPATGGKIMTKLLKGMTTRRKTSQPSFLNHRQ